MKQKCSVSFRQHGDLVLYDTFESHIGLKLFNYIRFKSNIDINYRLRPQTGHLNYIYQNQIYYLRISSLPGRELDSIVIRILNNHQQIALDKLTIFKETTVFLKPYHDFRSRTIYCKWSNWFRKVNHTIYPTRFN